MYQVLDVKESRTSLMGALKNWNFRLRTRNTKIKTCSIHRVCEHFFIFAATP